MVMKDITIKEDSLRGFLIFAIIAGLLAFFAFKYGQQNHGGDGWQPFRQPCACGWNCQCKQNCRPNGSTGQAGELEPVAPAHK